MSTQHEAHYFEFSRDFAGGKRVCGTCRRNYDDGNHIEITVLKPYTSYVCPSGGGLGHSSIYTGPHRPELRRVTDDTCICGKKFVEEDTEKWRLTWEMQWPGADHWTRVTVTKSKHAAQSQHEGLLELIANGEPIRNVTLFHEAVA